MENIIKSAIDKSYTDFKDAVKDKLEDIKQNNDTYKIYSAEKSVYQSAIDKAQETKELQLKDEPTGDE